MQQLRSAGLVVAPIALVAMFSMAAERSPPGEGAPPDLRWAAIPAGSFEMGCVPPDQSCLENELPRHAVTLSRAFEMMTTEITVGHYAAFIRETGHRPPPRPEFPQEPHHPVVHVTWGDAAAFCVWVGGRLPTEAEWEYAARSGHSGRLYGWGDQASHEWANYGRDACCAGTIAGRDVWAQTAPVASFPPNAFGLYDMAGNVWEWVADWYDEAYYGRSPTADPPGPASGVVRVARGGSWLNVPGAMRTSARLMFTPEGRTGNLGARCVRQTAAVVIASLTQKTVIER